MRCTLQFTADHAGTHYGIVKQIVFDSRDAADAYKAQNLYLEKFREVEMLRNGFAGFFIGHTLKLWEGESDFRGGRDSLELEFSGWYDREGIFHYGDPRKRRPPVIANQRTINFK